MAQIFVHHFGVIISVVIDKFRILVLVLGERIVCLRGPRRHSHSSRDDLGRSGGSPDDRLAGGAVTERLPGGCERFIVINRCLLNGGHRGPDWSAVLGPVFRPGWPWSSPWREGGVGILPDKVWDHVRCGCCGVASTLAGVMLGVGPCRRRDGGGVGEPLVLVGDRLGRLGGLHPDVEGAGGADQAHRLHLPRLVSLPLPVKVGGGGRGPHGDEVSGGRVAGCLPLVLVCDRLGGLGLHHLDIQGAGGSQRRKVLQWISVSEPALVLVVLVGAGLDQGEQRTLLGPLYLVDLRVGAGAVAGGHGEAGVEVGRRGPLVPGLDDSGAAVRARDGDVPHEALAGGPDHDPAPVADDLVAALDDGGGQLAGALPRPVRVGGGGSAARRRRARARVVLVPQNIRSSGALLLCEHLTEWIQYSILIGSKCRDINGNLIWPCRFSLVTTS